VQRLVAHSVRCAGTGDLARRIHLCIHLHTFVWERITVYKMAHICVIRCNGEDIYARYARYVRVRAYTGARVCVRYRRVILAHIPVDSPNSW
jgi:hypothetical protein